MNAKATITLIKCHGLRSWTVVATILSLLSVTSMVRAQTTIIYQDSFSRTGALFGTTPDVVNTGGATYSGADDLQSDGSQVFWTYPNPEVRTNADLTTYSYYENAFLPFTPQAGHVYSLSADIQPLGTNDQWLALGFTGLNAVSNSYFLKDANPFGAPWMLVRGSNRQFQNFAQGGNRGNVNGPGFGMTNVIDYLSIVLDTTTPLWSVSWQTNGVQMLSYTYTANPTINYVGFGADNTVGVLDNFTLLDTVPEPSVAGILALGGALFGLCFWRMSKRKSRA